MISTELDLDSIEAQEAAALAESQRLRRIEAVRVQREAEAKAQAEAAVKVLPAPGTAADAISNAILLGNNARLDFEGSDGTPRRADVRDLGPRCTKEQTLEMRSMLNLGGIRALDMLTAKGWDGLHGFWNPGKSTCMNDKGFHRIFRALSSLESRTDRMTVAAFNILTPTFKLLKRRAH